MVWSPPRVMTLGSVLPLSEGPFLLASVAGGRERMLLWPFSICWIAYALSYLFVGQHEGSRNTDQVRTHEVTGMSPQSRTVAQLWNGFASSGTL